eukprot:12520745-Alexandrium_andersonii.AAC.1
MSACPRGRQARRSGAVGGVRGKAPAEKAKHMEALRPRSGRLQEGPGVSSPREPPARGRPPAQPPIIRGLVQRPPGAP